MPSDGNRCVWNMQASVRGISPFSLTRSQFVVWRGVDVMHSECIFMLSPVEKPTARLHGNQTQLADGWLRGPGAEVRGKGPPGRFGGKRPDL